jgi:hypothetical protein
MKDLIQTLQDAFPPLKNHPILMARLTLLLIVLVWLFWFKGWRKKACRSLHSRLCEKIFSTSRWLRVYQEGSDMAQWKYYTSEVDGTGKNGDDMIWTLVHWPSLKPKDSFRVHGAVGMLSGVYDSRALLKARWGIVHDPDSFFGPVPARGLKSLLRRAAAKVMGALASI